MFVLVVLFEMGSSLLVGMGAGAGQDAWIAILMGMSAGLLLFLVYYRLFLYYPDLPLTSFIQEIVGKWLGRFIGIIYVVWFMYIASRVLRDFGELLTTTIYTSTPMFILNTLMILTIIYAIHKGFEVIARVGELYFLVVYFMAIGGMVLIVISGLIHLENLLPIFDKGWKPVLRTFVKETLTFPFGEMVVFTMFLPFLKDPKKVRKACMGGMLLSGINITITAVINIAALGGDLFVRSNFPLLTTIGKIELANFIERLDVLFMLYLVIGGFFKIAIFYYAAVAGAADIFQFKDQKKLGFPIGLIILIASMMIASNFSEHIIEGLQIVSFYVSWPMQIIIPSLLLVIAFFKNRKKNKSSP